MAKKTEMKWERQILWRILLDNDELDKPGIASLTAEDFEDVENAMIFAGMQCLRRRGEAIDLITLLEYFNRHDALHEVGGAHNLASLIPHP
jgi:replicative DNA helicase